MNFRIPSLHLRPPLPPSRPKNDQRLEHTKLILLKTKNCPIYCVLNSACIFAKTLHKLNPLICCHCNHSNIIISNSLWVSEFADATTMGDRNIQPNVEQVASNLCLSQNRNVRQTGKVVIFVLAKLLKFILINDSSFRIKNPHTRLNYERPRMKTALMNGIKKDFNFIVIAAKRRKKQPYTHIQQRNDYVFIYRFASVVFRSLFFPDTGLPSSVCYDRDSFTWTNIIRFLQFLEGIL